MLSSISSSTGFRLTSVILNGVKREIGNEETIKDLCQRNHVQMSSFCRYGEATDCSLCKVSIDGEVSSPCIFDIKEGSKIVTNSEEINKINKELMLKKTPIPEVYFNNKTTKDNTLRAIELDPTKCIEGCRKCVDVCPKSALVLNPRVQPFGNASLLNSGCTSCGFCTKVCPGDALTYKYNIELFDAAMKQDTVKIAVIDSLIIDKVSSILNKKMTFDDMSVTLKSLGFEYIMDSGLCRDFAVVMDAARIYQQMAKGDAGTASTFCPSVQKSLFTLPVIQPLIIAEKLLPNVNVSTFVFTHCPTLISENTISISTGRNKIHKSVAFSPQELADIIKRNENKKQGEKCKILGHSSAESLNTASAEKFANAVIYCFAKQYLSKSIPNLEFKKLDKDTKLAEVDFGGKTKAKVVIVKGANGVNKVFESGMENILYIVGEECESCGDFFEVDTNKEMHSEVVRKVKRAYGNALATNLYNKYLDEEIYEKFVNESDTYY
jgi:ferredoxin